MDTKIVADIVEGNRRTELSKEHRNDVAPRREGSRLLVDAMLPSQFVDQVPGNKLADLTQSDYFGFRLGLGCFTCLVSFHTPIRWREAPSFQLFLRDACGL